MILTSCAVDETVPIASVHGHKQQRPPDTARCELVQLSLTPDPRRERKFARHSYVLPVEKGVHEHGVRQFLQSMTVLHVPVSPMAEAAAICIQQCCRSRFTSLPAGKPMLHASIEIASGGSGSGGGSGSNGSVGSGVGSRPGSRAGSRPSSRRSTRDVSGSSLCGMSISAFGYTSRPTSGRASGATALDGTGALATAIPSSSIPSTASQLALQRSSYASASRRSAPYRATYLLAPPPSTAPAEGSTPTCLRASPRPLSARCTALHLSLQLPAESADAGTVETVPWQQRRDEAFVSGTGVTRPRPSRPTTARSAAARCPAGWNGCRSARAPLERSRQRSPPSESLSCHQRHSAERSPQRLPLLEWQPLTTRALEGAGLLAKAHLGTSHKPIAALPTVQRMYRSKIPAAAAPLPGTVAPTNSPPQTPLHTPLRTPRPTPPQTPQQSPPQSPPPELADAPDTALNTRHSVLETALREEHQTRHSVLETAPREEHQTRHAVLETAFEASLEVALEAALLPPQAVPTPSALTSPAASALRPRSGAVPVPKGMAKLLEMSSATLEIPPAIAHSARGGVYSPRQLRLIGPAHMSMRTAAFARGGRA